MTKVLIAVLGVAAIVLVVGIATNGSSGAAPSATEAQVAAQLADDIKADYGTDAWYPTLQQANGAPNVEVVATTAWVFTNIAATDLGKANAVTICHDAAAVAGPLGLAHVKVDGGHQELAACDSP